jgi:hypothetical protein
MRKRAKRSPTGSPRNLAQAGNRRGSKAAALPTPPMSRSSGRLTLRRGPAAGAIQMAKAARRRLGSTSPLVCRDCGKSLSKTAMKGPRFLPGMCEEEEQGRRRRDGAQAARLVRVEQRLIAPWLERDPRE